MTDSMDANGNGKRPNPECLFEKQNRQYSESEPDCPDLDYQYADCDSLTAEMAELYSYTEQPEFHLNLKNFEEQMESYNLSPFWQKLDRETKQSVVWKLLDQLDVSDNIMRMKAARSLLYIVQGCWAEVQSDCEQQHWTRENVLLLYHCGVFPALVETLETELEDEKAAANAIKKIALSLTDSNELRVILTTMYVMVEVMRCIGDADPEEDVKAREAFKAELNTEFDDELLSIKLLRMVSRFCLGQSPHYPIKKILLLLWKVLLYTLGGMETLRRLRKEYRAREGLDDAGEDPIEITRHMRASSPPANAGDLIEVQHQKRTNRPLRKSLMKQSSLDEPCLDFDSEGGEESEMRDMEELNAPEDTPTTQEAEQEQEAEVIQEEPEMGSPQPSMPVTGKGLPWAPKVRNRDLDSFLETTRIKFVGYSLPGDRDTTVGLPQPICEGVSVLKRHIFTSLSEIQIEREEKMAKYPFSHPEPTVPSNPTEILYEAMLPRLPQYMIGLLKVLLAAAPTSKTKTESINIVADVLPAGMPFTMLQSMKLSVDVSRHKEIIVKAVSATLLLLLKHFKLSHVYQFEFISQHLVFANCIPLVLKFLNQNILAYISARNIIPIMDFPTSVIGDQPDLNPDTFDLEIGDNQLYSWRNMFSCINVLRILNKLTKWKHSRIMMLVVFKSAPILKKTLKVRHPLLQLYVLKLLKMQTKYLGRQWRKSNMKTLSAIYQKVRHRLNDDWAFGNDLDARPWDFQADECALRTCVDRFNARRYNEAPPDRDFEPVDSCITSVLGQPLELTDEFKQHYELWLEEEVMKSEINWDELLAHGFMG